MMPVWREGVEFQRGAVTNAAATVAREQRFFAWHIELACKYWLELLAQTVGERGQFGVRHLRTRSQYIVADEQAHGLEESEAAGVVRSPTLHRVTVASSPRRSMRTSCRRAEIPWTPREW